MGIVHSFLTSATTPYPVRWASLIMIETEEQLNLIIQEIKKNTPDENLLLFRGQTCLYENMRSERARPNVNANKQVEIGWNTIVNRITQRYENNLKHNQAILQHYGFPTYFLDLTKNPKIASWFACNEFKKLEPLLYFGKGIRIQDEASYEEIKTGIGYLIILEIPNFKNAIENNELFDISNESMFLRAKNQEAYLLLDQPPRLPNPNNFIIKVLKINRTKFKSSITIKELFPNPKIDKGYAYLLDTPYIQSPPYLFKPSENNNKNLTFNSLDEYCTPSKRLINIPLYVNHKKDIDDFNPKWKDKTLFEPLKFRNWQIENFEISNIHEGQNGNFKDSAKITIPPDILNKILVNVENNQFEWPEINSESILFTFAELDHDKVSEHTPPYYGIWLHKDNDLLLENSLTVDSENNIKYEPGHAFVINNGKIEYVKTKNECDCGNYETHLVRISILLTINSLIKKQEIALVQHPFKIENWYILI